MENAMFIGVDIGGTHMRTALVGENGRIALNRKVLTEIDLGGKHTAEKLISECRNHIESAASLGTSVAAIGLSVAGKIDPREGLVVFSPNLPALDNYPIAVELGHRLGIPVIMENDANAFGIGEGWAGAGSGLENWIGITLGTGVGGCVILNGRLWHGDDIGFAGEVGHMIIQPEGLPCACGLRGCLEAYASASALVNSTRRAVLAGEVTDGPLFDLWKTSTLDAGRVYECAMNGDPTAQRLFQRMGWALGLAIANIFTLMGMRHAIIGGGVSAAWDQFIGSLQKSLAEHTCMLPPAAWDVRRGALRDNAALVGAARLAAEHYQTSIH